MQFVYIAAILVSVFRPASSIWCYQCIGSHPGCGLDGVDWRYYWGSSCEDTNDVCVKIIEQIDSETIVTRDCLSNLEGHRRDIPNDRYEGCRPATQDVLLGNYIFPSIPEIDQMRTHFSNVTFCFCSFDERCNGAESLARFSSTHLLLMVGAGLAALLAGRAALPL